MSGLLEFIADQNSKSDLANWAQKNLGDTNPGLAQLAQADPNSFRQMLPSIIQQQMQQSALAQLSAPSPATSPAAAPQYAGSVGDSQPNAPIPQGLPSNYDPISSEGQSYYGNAAQSQTAQPTQQQTTAQQSAFALLPQFVRAAGGNLGQGVSALKEFNSLTVPPGMGAIPQGQRYVNGQLQTVPGAMTEGQKDRDKDFADVYTPFKMTGGMQNQQTQIAGIQNVIDKLNSGDVTTGHGTLAPFALNDEGDAGTVGRLADNSFLQANNQVMKAVLPSSKAMFGARVTQKEVALNLMANGLNPYASNEENIANLTTLKNNLLQANQSTAAAGDYFDKHGTLAGYQGMAPGISAPPVAPSSPALSQIAPQQQNNSATLQALLAEKARRMGGQ